MPSVKTDNPTGPEYWRSLDELADTPEFRAIVEKEFPTYAPSLMTRPSRRTFLKLMGASMALAGLAGCRRFPKRKLAPHTARPEGHVPGEPEFYASAYELAGVAKPVVLTSYDGRPVKVEGNGLHPASGGAADSFAQASVLELYDPHRSRTVMHDGNASSWDAYDAWAGELFEKYKQNGGQGLAFLIEGTSSPTIIDNINRTMSEVYPSAAQSGCIYEAAEDLAAAEGAKLAFGKVVRSHYDLSQADVIVSLDSNFLGEHPDRTRLAREFADGRRSVDSTGKMNRLYVAESAFTITGAMADERLPAKAGDISKLATLLMDALNHKTLDEADPMAKHAMTVAHDLEAHKGQGIVIPGPTQPAEVHALCHAINKKIGAVGKTVTYSNQYEWYRPDLISGAETLVILGGNPVYDGTPQIKAAIDSAKTVIHLSLYQNETSAKAAWHLPRAHYLESWGDCRSYDGTVSIVQPMIMPLYEGRSIIELLSGMAGIEDDAMTLVQKTHGLSEKAWRKALHDGLIEDSGFKTAKPRAKSVTFNPTASEGVEVVLRPDCKLYDGRFANNGWLQELPDPMTRMTWDNTATISVPDAKQWGVKHGDVLAITANGKTVELPAFIQPGHPVGSISLALGYGRTKAGPVGDNVGVDVYPLRADTGFVLTASSVKPTGKNVKLANTNDHFAIDATAATEREKRSGLLIRKNSIGNYQHDPDHAFPHEHKVKLPVIVDTDMQADPGYDKTSQSVVPDGFTKERGPQQFVNPLDSAADENASAYQWGMVVDLNTCIGCGDCVIACQAENNIPIVGKSQVIMNREMHWLRIDRYYQGDPSLPDKVESVSQPMMCLHCETAPCEQVCPVAATVHDDEGLNVMVYNRCIGTRYCANNCPYKVRRFNYFDYARDGCASPR